MLGKRPNANLARFYRSLPAEFDRFERRGTALVLHPVNHILCGYCFEPHGGTPKDQRWVHWFVQLLTEPQDFLGLGFGWRIPNIRPQTPMPLYQASWGHTPQDTIDVMRNEGLPLLAKYGNLEGLYELSCDFSIDLSMAHYWRYNTACLTSILLDMPLDTARVHIEQVRLCIPKVSQDFERELLEQCDQLENRIDSEGRAGALLQLREWEIWTVGQLKLDDMYDGSIWTNLLCTDDAVID